MRTLVIVTVIGFISVFVFINVSRAEGFGQMNVQQLAQTKNAFILDVREPWEYEQGHIKGAQLIPLGELSTRLDELPENGPIHVVCRSGNRSAQASALLVQAGRSDVINISGGMLAWAAAGLPTVR